ncbi:MAG TPA: 3-oxoacyl-[acyl-carrier-protein] synthase III C-terminal domain-containing protein [Methylocella sp.]|nr:3-oxoacyl-[acyl-carrier-protein] synthase III C-terminal domain-containing protein [Methylocella sp.]
MKIAATAYRIPSKRLSNEDLIDLIDKNNPDVSFLKKKILFRAMRCLYEKVGAESRHIRDGEKGEKAADLISAAMDDALTKAGMIAADVDILIYCGVGKGFLEPANAYFYAQAKGMVRANCFDITDACMSWIRALQVAYLMLRAGSARTVMIVNGEFHAGLRHSWRIPDLTALKYTFPTYTIGEAATATIVTGSDAEWSFDYASRCDLADLCTIPLEGYDDYVGTRSERIGLNGINSFVSFGRELFNEANELLGPLIRRSIPELLGIRWYFPHAPSKTLYEENMPKWGVPSEKVFLRVFPRFGNLVSASIPVGLALAQEEGVLQRGDPIAFVPASAGMVASVVQLAF